MKERKTRPLPKAGDGVHSAPLPPRPSPNRPRPKGSKLTDEQWDEMMRKVDVVLDSEQGPFFAAIVDVIFKHCAAAEHSKGT